MPDQPPAYTIGVEEEFATVDRASRALSPLARRVLDQVRPVLGAEILHPELRDFQLETATPVCATLAEVRARLAEARSAVGAAARGFGGALFAASTHPFSHWSEQGFSPEERYQDLAATYEQLAREQMIAGCHVHVGLADREAALQVLNRVRPWLAPLLALSASSPYWLGEDTGYASYRTVLWGRWPTAGPPLAFPDLAEHDRLIAALVAAGSIKDASHVYWDVRLPARLPTVEFRVADVCPALDGAVMLAGLARALVHRTHGAAARGEPVPNVRHELLRAAHWRAARHGLGADLIDPLAEAAIPAPDMVTRLLEYARPSLEEFGDWDEVSGLVRRTLERGNGATLQRAAYARCERMEDVVDAVVAETAR